MALEPDVDRRLVLLQLHHAPFVEQRHDGAIGHRLVDGVGVNHAAELGHVALLAGQQRRAGEADVAGIGEHLPHARRVAAQLGALGFVHQHEDVGRGVAELLVSQRLVELVHQGGDDVRLAVGHQFHQMAAALGPVRRQAAGREGVAELLVQVHPVGHQHDARIADGRLQRQRARQHHHGQRLARALGVPDDAAATLAAVVRLPDAGEHLADGEHLLVARDLAHAAVEHGEGPGHLQQALRAAQRVERAVLLGHLPAHQIGRNLLAHAQLGKGQIEQRGLHRLRQRALQQRRDFGVGYVLLPLRPELGRGAGGGVAGFILVHRQHGLHVGKQARDVFVALVADGLRDGLGHLDLRRLALDHREGNAVDEQYDVRPTGLDAAGALHGEFGGHVVDVVRPTCRKVAPVHVVQRETLQVTLDGLLQRHAQGQQVVDRLVGLEQPVIFDVLQPLDGALDVLLAEEIRAALVLDAVQLLHLLAQNLLQQYIAGLAATRGQRLGGRQVLVAQVDQHLQGRNLGEVFLVEAEAAFGGVGV